MDWGGGGVKDTLKTERAVIGAVLMDPARCIPVAVSCGAEADWFADDTAHVAWMAVASLWRRGLCGEADMVAILNEFRRIAETAEVKKKFAPRVDAAAWDELIDGATSSASLEYHLGELRDAHVARCVQRAVQKTSAAFATSDAVTAAIGLRSEIDAILAGNASAAGRRVSLGEVANELLGEYELAHQRRIVEKDLHWTPGYRFPWAPMTAMMNGLEPGLGIIAARPSVGKTLFALNLIRYWCDTGVKVVFNSLDMEQHSLVRRFVAERARVSIKKARFSPTQADLAAMRTAADELAAWPLSMVEIRDVEEFESFCMIEHAAGRCQIAVVDYLGLLHSSRVDNANEYARVSYVSDKLKTIANRLRIPVIALCQLNREITKDAGLNRLPGLADLRGSGSIEQDAFWVLFLHRDERTVNGVWRDTPPTQLVPPATSAASLRALDSVLAVLCKAQNGELGSLPFVFRKNYLSCSLGDWRTPPTRTAVGYGAAAKEVTDYSAQFAKVCTDWRHDPLEEVLRRQGALIDLDETVEG